MIVPPKAEDGTEKDKKIVSKEGNPVQLECQVRSMLKPGSEIAGSGNI